MTNYMICKLSRSHRMPMYRCSCWRMAGWFFIMGASASSELSEEWASRYIA